MEWLIAIVLMVVIGYVSWKAGMEAGHGEAMNKVHDDKDKRLVELREVFRITRMHESGSSIGLRYANFELYDEEIGPLLIVRAKDLIESAVGSRIDMLNVAYGSDIEEESDEESGDDKVDEFNMLCENVRKEVIEEFVKENDAMAESVKARLLNDIG